MRLVASGGIQSVGDDVINKIKAAKQTGNDGDFAGLVDNVKTVSADFYHLLEIIAGFGGVCMLIIALIMWMVAQNPQGKQQAKTKAIWILVGIACFFFTVWIVATVYEIGRGL